MDENLDLTKILKDCPRGTKFWTDIWGEVTFEKIEDNNLAPIFVSSVDEKSYEWHERLTPEGKLYGFNGCMVIYPSKEQRDWGKWVCPKNPKEDLPGGTLVL